MKPIFWQTPLYTFLLYTNGEGLEKEVLDLGAGGERPPLALFAEHGYKAYGIDCNEEQIERASRFAEKHDLDLNITMADLRELPFEDNFINYAYSYNTIFHLSKKNILQAVREIERVLRPGGLCFINFASSDDFRSSIGEKVGEGEYLQEEWGELVLHSYHHPAEAETYFEKVGLKVIFKERRIREGMNRKGEKITRGFIDYIVQKKKDSGKVVR